jgi:hypothetical protein
MAPVFLYQRWLKEALADYTGGAPRATLRGRGLRLTPRQYAAALMQTYQGRFSLTWIAEITGLSLEDLKRLRREPGFLLVMDWSKTAFSQSFREALRLTDYTISQYHEIAGEFFLLEDSLRIAVRTRLYQVFQDLGERLGSGWQHALPLERQDLTLFARLLLFFLVLEHYWPSPAAARIQEKFLPLAREVVWPFKGRSAVEVEVELAAARKKYPLDQIRALLAASLREVFARLS